MQKSGKAFWQVVVTLINRTQHYMKCVHIFCMKLKTATIDSLALLGLRMLSQQAEKKEISSKWAVAFLRSSLILTT